MIRRIILFFSAFVLSLVSLNAQDYQTVRSGRIAYFSNDQGFIKCIRIDSVAFQTDSVLFPMANIEQLASNCFNPKGSSWIGKKVIIQNDGTNLFFNRENDTIRIKTLAKAGESWTLYEFKDSIKVIAEVKSSEIQTILGEQDSVKTIGLTVYDKNGVVSNHFLSGKTIIISKNNGFVKAMSFNEFPEDRDFTYFERLEVLSLIGLTNPDRGVQNLTWLGVNDYQVGDELHVTRNSWNWSYVPGYRNELKTIWKFLERKESEDSVFYRIERKESLKKYKERWDNITYRFTHDTIIQVYRPDSIFDKLPGELVITDFQIYSNVIVNEGQFIRKFESAPLAPGNETDSCWHYLIFDGGGMGYYLRGLGGPYYEYNEIIIGDERTMVYYKKGTTKWGTPLVVTDVKSLEREEQVKIFPNPATDFVVIENLSGSTEKYELSVMDLQGREVWRNSIAFSNTYRLDVSFLKEGAYLLKLQNDEKQVSRMIVKKP